MDTILANSQANLAYKQRELATQTKLQLLPNPEINALEREQMDITEELNQLTRNNQFEVERSRRESATTPGGVDHISQLQKTQIQLRIAERQVNVAERQLQIATAHVQHAMDPMLYTSQLSQQSDIRKAEEFRKKAVPLFSEATELLKQARHSVAFKEMGARMGMGGSFRRDHPYQHQTSSYAEKGKEMAGDFVEGHGNDVPGPIPSTSFANHYTIDNGNINSQRHSPPPSYTEGPIHIFQPSTSAPGIMSTAPVSTTRENHQIQPLKQKSKSGCCSPLTCFLVILVLLIIGGGGFAAYWFLLKKDD